MSEHPYRTAGGPPLSLDEEAALLDVRRRAGESDEDLRWRVEAVRALRAFRLSFDLGEPVVRTP